MENKNICSLCRNEVEKLMTIKNKNNSTELDICLKCMKKYGFKTKK